MRLYHFTCDHGHEALTREGMLQPMSRWNAIATIQLRAQRHGWLADVIWLTDLDHPNADALGLTMKVIGCDRTAHRWRMASWHGTDRHATLPEPWVWWAAGHAGTVPRPDRDLLESAVGAEPLHWWISTVPVPVIYDPIGATS